MLLRTLPIEIGVPTVAGSGPDSKHLKSADSPDELPSIEFDYAVGSGNASDPEASVTLLTAHESVHGGTFATQIRQRGPKDEYVMQACLNWINSLGHATIELKCGPRAQHD